MSITHLEVKPFTWIKPEIALISRCDLDLYFMDDGAVVIAADSEVNAGMDLAEAGPLVVAAVMDKYGLQPGRFRWIERIQTGDAKEERFEAVRFDFEGGRPHSPVRSAIDAESVARLVKGEAY